MKFSFKPKSFQADVRSILDSAAEKNLFVHALFLSGNNGSIAVFSPDQNVDWQAKLTALFIHSLVDANGSDPDDFIDKILAEVAKIKED